MIMYPILEGRTKVKCARANREAQIMHIDVSLVVKYVGKMD